VFPRSAFCLCFFAVAACWSGCVRETSAPAVSVSGGQVYAPRDFYGRWLRPGERLHIQPPPAPGFVRVLLEDGTDAAYGEDDAERQRLFFTITRIDRLPEERFRFHLRPAQGGIRPEQRVLRRPEDNRMLEYREGGTQIVVWRRG